MAAQPFRVQLDRRRVRRFLVTLSLINVLLAATTTAFITLWARMDQLSPAAQNFTRYVLVQGHLATENVVAAWYSSMLLLVIAAASVLAFAEDRRQCAGPLTVGWLLFAAVFTVLSLDEIGSLHERIGMIRTTATSGQALGWAYLLAVPIALVGLFMLAFGWLHVRRVPAAFGLVTAGVALFLMDPVLEVIEMSLIHGAGAAAGTPQRMLHDFLLVLEEGGLELFGILCFLAAVVRYLQASAGDASEWVIDGRRVVWVIGAVAVTLLAGTWSARWLVARLPPGDTGIPQNWFPAAALLMTALFARGPFRAAAVLLSAFFGAGFHGYTTWHAYDLLRVTANIGLALFFGVALWMSGGVRVTALFAAVTIATAVNLTGEYAPLLAIVGAALAARAVTMATHTQQEAGKSSQSSSGLLPTA